MRFCSLAPPGHAAYSKADCYACDVRWRPCRSGWRRQWRRSRCLARAVLSADRFSCRFRARRGWGCSLTVRCDFGHGGFGRAVELGWSRSGAAEGWRAWLADQHTCYADVLGSERQQRKLASALECDVQRSLVRGACAGLAAGLDLAAFGQKASQADEVLVIDLFDLVDAELTDLAPGSEFAGSAEFTGSASSGARTASTRTGRHPPRQDSDFMISRISSAVSLGVRPTWTPAASRASFLAAAVPDEPDTMAPACPMVLPSGAVNPASSPLRAYRGPARVSVSTLRRKAPTNRPWPSRRASSRALRHRGDAAAQPRSVWDQRNSVSRLGDAGERRAARFRQAHDGACGQNEVFLRPCDSPARIAARSGLDPNCPKWQNRARPSSVKRRHARRF